MALVMLPCDLPWWDNVKDHLTRIGKIDNVEELIDEMEKLYELCNISLDPDDENPEPDLFKGFELFLKNDLTKEENSNFFNKTLKIISNRALQLKDNKPKNGLHFSLQQQPDYTELDYEFVSSLIANAFFSTFPKRTIKSHPTLRNFNFSNFFKNLHLNVQKTKLKSILHYFDWLNINLNNNCGKLKIIRNVMNGKEWLTIEDWLECNLPLCQIIIKHDGKIERSEANSLKILFASSKIGEKVLIDGISQESINLITFPELLIILLNVESLEDNEVLTIDNVRHITRINDPKNKAILEKLEYPYTTSICCMDADNYTKLPIGQYEEDNILRELNKCLLGFQQKQQNLNNNNNENYTTTTNPHQRTRKLSPIGEKTIPLITQESCSTTRSDSFKLNDTNDNKLKVQRNINSELVHNRRGKFIVLGSSGECLPVTRRPLETMKTIYSSCNSSDEEFHSAKTSLDDDSEDDTFHHKYSIDLDTSERREIFAKKIKNVLNNENSSSSTDSNSYAVGISITGSEVRDTNIKVKRDGSTGFALKEESLDELFLQNSLTKEQKWIDKFKNKQQHSPNNKESNKSSEYSFSTEYSSELEEVYEQFSKWLDDPILKTDNGTTKKELNNRELAVVKFAGSLLKRTLSESFAGIPVPLTEEIKNNTDTQKKLVLNAKSLSLELAKHKHKLAAQLVSKKKKLYINYNIEPIIQTLNDIDVSINNQQLKKLTQITETTNGLKPIATGNWGCGTSRKGDVQLKVIIQWLSASVSGVPQLIYYTNGNQQISKLDTICRLLIDRKWCVKDLTQAILRYSNKVLQGKEISGNLFQELIGQERL